VSDQFCLLVTNVIICRPANPEELSNLHHALVCNMIKCIFGVLKRHFHILVHLSITCTLKHTFQLVALHNFICDYDPFEISDLDDIDDDQPGPQLGDQASTGDLVDGILQRAEREKADDL
jgi:hypothetical protein